MKINITLFAAMALIISAVAAVGAQESLGLPRLPDDPVKIAAGEEKMRQLEQLTRQGKDALAKGDTLKAIDFFEQRLRFGIHFETALMLSNIYLKLNRTDDTIRSLRLLIYPSKEFPTGTFIPTIRMKYVLALLEQGEWEEAVIVYERSFSNPQQSQPSAATQFSWVWALPVPWYQGPSHTLPKLHFSVDTPQYLDLEEQCHLVLGARMPELMATKDMPAYMLGHLQKLLKLNRSNLDALFISGELLTVLERYDEARAMYKSAAKIAPNEAKPEIDVAVKELKTREDQKKYWEAQQKRGTTGTPASAPP